MLTSSLKSPKPANWQGVCEGLAVAVSSFQRHEYEQAIDVLYSVLEFAPAEGKAWHLLGKAHQHMGDHGAALGFFKQAECYYSQHNLHEEMPIRSVHIARTLWNQGCQMEAESMVKALLEEHPDDQRLHTLVAMWSQTI